MYEVLLERRAQRDIRALEDEIQQRVIAAIEELSDDPRPAGCRKLVGSKSDWRIRVGDFRVIYEIDDAADQVRVMYVRHRRDALSLKREPRGIEQEPANIEHSKLVKSR